MQHNANVYPYLSTSIRKLKDIAHRAIEANGRLIQYVPKELLTNDDIAIGALTSNWSEAIHYVPEHYTTDPTLIQHLVIQEPAILFHVDISLLDDEKIIGIVEANPYALHGMPDHLIESKKLQLIAIGQDPDLYELCPDSLRNDVDIQTAKFKKGPFQN